MLQSMVLPCSTGTENWSTRRARKGDRWSRWFSQCRSEVRKQIEEERGGAENNLLTRFHIPDRFYFPRITWQVVWFAVLWGHGWSIQSVPIAPRTFGEDGTVGRVGPFGHCCRWMPGSVTVRGGTEERKTYTWTVAVLPKRTLSLTHASSTHVTADRTSAQIIDFSTWRRRRNGLYSAYNQETPNVSLLYHRLQTTCLL
jgi:hypothetical protein